MAVGIITAAKEELRGSCLKSNEAAVAGGRGQIQTGETSLCRILTDVIKKVVI